MSSRMMHPTDTVGTVGILFEPRSPLMDGQAVPLWRAGRDELPTVSRTGTLQVQMLEGTRQNKISGCMHANHVVCDDSDKKYHCSLIFTCFKWLMSHVETTSEANGGFVSSAEPLPSR